MKTALVFFALLGALFVWQYRTRRAASAERLARVLQLDPRKVEPSTRALVLLETIPRLRGSDREVAVKRLRSTLQAIPRRILAHRPSWPVEVIRFSGHGRSMLWYGKAADRIIIERWSERERRVVTWSAAASNATFLDETGLQTFTDEDPGRRKGSARTARTGSGVVMSRDGGYLSLVEDGVLSIWGVRDVADRPAGKLPLFSAGMPYATTRLHCIRSAAICGLDSLGRFTIIDVKKGKTLRSIVTDRAAIVHMSPSGGLVGVAGRRAGMTIHAARHGRKIHVDTSSLALEDFAFSADEKSVVILDSDGVLHSYDVATGKPRARSPVLRHEQWKSPAHVETAGDGRFVVWAAEKVRLVSADLSTVAGRFDEGGEVVLVKTNRRGDRLAIARRAGPLTLWEVSTKPALPIADAELIDEACDHIGRPLTADEWAAYIPDRRYFPQCR